MTDQEYIQAFRARDNKAITLFYREQREKFMAFLADKFNVLNQDLLIEVFQESVSHLWENIELGKLSETNMTSSLTTYFFSIGLNQMKETLRKYQEDVPNDEEIYSKAAAQHEVESAHEEERINARQDRRDAIRKVVDSMGKPCAPLLKAFYWSDSPSWDTIAWELHYSNADSAKTQKYKCMQKLKTLLKRP